MICVTGAGGTVGSELVRQLGAARVPFRAAFNSPDKAQAARARGVDAAVVDYHEPDTLRAALRGCDALFLLAPSVPDQTELELHAVETASAAGLRRIVKQSVYDAAEEGFAIARIHRPVEKAIEASGLAFTFLRPNAFMQNVVTYMGPTIRAESAFYSAAGDGRIAHVDVRDIAAVAVAALTRPGHDGKAYSLTGSEALTYDEVAAELSRALGRTIRHVNLPPEDYRAGMLAEGLPEQLADAMTDLERLYREGQASEVSGDVKLVTGQEPRRFAAYARECAPQLQPDAHGATKAEVR